MGRGCARRRDGQRRPRPGEPPTLGLPPAPDVKAQGWLLSEIGVSTLRATYSITGVPAWTRPYHSLLRQGGQKPPPAALRSAHGTEPWVDRRIRGALSSSVQRMASLAQPLHRPSRALPFYLPGGTITSMPSWAGLPSARRACPRMWRSWELAEALGVSVPTVQLLVKRGRIPVHRLSPKGRMFFDWPAVRRALRLIGPSSID